jgi:agmatine deiminase
MPAEYEAHEGTWLAWPHNTSHWPGKFEPIPQTYRQIVAAIADSEKVFICVNDEKAEQEAKKVLGEELANNPNVQFFHIPTDASWSRDHGPIFVYNEKNERVITDWIFNAWGDKYKPYDQDDIVPQKIGKMLNIPVIEPKMVLEGGSIEVNGQGTLMTTRQCLLNKNRNPHLSQEEIEKKLGEYLGVRHFLWLEEGIIGDDTDGHIDDIARFTDAHTIACAYEEDESDENYTILKKNYDDLCAMKDQDGNPFTIVKVPMPRPVIYEDQRLPASYVNFLITNKNILLPVFSCDRDKSAHDIMQSLFPDKKIIDIDCVDLIWGLGTIHCSTQQQPKV